MIPYVNTVLEEWARWAASELIGGRVKISSAYKLVRIAGDLGRLPLPSELSQVVELVDAAVTYLPGHLHAVVVACYLHRAESIEAKLRQLRLCQSTYYGYLHEAHILILEAINLGDVREVPALADQYRKRVLAIKKADQRASRRAKEGSNVQQLEISSGPLQ